MTTAVGGERKGIPNKELHFLHKTHLHTLPQPPSAYREISEPSIKIGFLRAAEMKATTLTDKDLWARAVACKKPSF